MTRAAGLDDIMKNSDQKEDEQMQADDTVAMTREQEGVASGLRKRKRLYNLHQAKNFGWRKKN